MNNDSYEILESGIATQNNSKVVNGVAIGEGDLTRGMSGKATRWPAEALRDGVDKLIGVPIVKDHPGTKKTEEGLQVDSQPPISSKIGEVTDAKYKDGVGLLWQGRITDDEILSKVEQGLAEVSPVLSREIRPVEGEDDVFEATTINAVRDIGVVARGASSSNSIQTGMAAMSAEALASEFGGDSSETTPAESGPDGPGSDDGLTSQSSAANNNTNETMSEQELSSDEKAILAASKDLNDPVEVLNDWSAAEQPTITEHDTIEQKDEQIEALQGEVDEAKDLYADALSEKWDTSKEKIKDSFSLEALKEEFEDEDGNLDSEALVQVPETQTPESTDSGVEALSEDADLEKAEALYNDYETYGVEGLKEDITEALCVSEWDDAMEVLE